MPTPEIDTPVQPISVLTVPHEQQAQASVGEGPPVLAEIRLQDKPALLVKTDERLSKAPDTTDEENRHSANQRKVNNL